MPLWMKASHFALLMEVHDAEITAIVPNYFGAGFG